MPLFLSSSPEWLNISRHEINMNHLNRRLPQVHKRSIKGTGFNLNLPSANWREDRQEGSVAQFWGGCQSYRAWTGRSTGPASRNRLAEDRH